MATKTKKKPTPKKTRIAKERPVLVTTSYRGVFFGYATKTDGDVIKLSRGRNIVYWTAANRGFVGLATHGPQQGAKVGPAADMELRGITSIVEVSPEAVARFEASPWA